MPVRSDPAGSRRLRMARTWLLVAGAAAVASGCELTAVEVARPADVVVAEVVLRSGTDDGIQRAFLHRTVDGEDGDRRVPGAVVRVIGEADTLRFDELDSAVPCVPEASERDGSCYVAGNRRRPGGDFVAPGHRYSLEIVLPDGRRLTGETTVPGSFTIVEPTDSLSVASDPVELVWTRSAGARSYQVVAEFSDLRSGLLALGVEDPPDRLDLTGLGISAADTTLLFPNDLGVFQRFSLDRDLLLALQQGLPAGSTADVAVAAAEGNYVNWVRGGNFNPSGQVRVPSIGGDGTGVFGAVVTRQITITNPVALSMPGAEPPSPSIQ